MQWKYYIASRWDTDRAVSEDVHLLPDDPSYLGESLWLSVYALGCCTDEAERQEVLNRLAGQAYSIHSADMFVAVDDFTKQELLKWVEIWFNETGIAADKFVPAPFEDFADRSDLCRLLAGLRKKYADESGV